MKVDKKGHTTIIKDTKGDIQLFLENITNEYHNFKSDNLILDVSHATTISLANLVSFKDLAKKHKKAKKSLVIVAENINFNDVPDYLHIVPSVLEAHDIIEMEEIERDLGF
ncbi:ribonuclease Z [Flavobacterium sp.]|uniref:ribonuclease Z n=1 Tax=Flavobacterium sp. TaxID=239 RepID=UPI0035292D53